VTAELTALVAWLREQTWSDFAQDLVAYAERRGQLTSAQESAALRMKETCETRQRPAARSTYDAVPDVPAGRYAVEHVEDGVLRFYVVDRPTEGRWAGRTFVKVQASDELYPVRGSAGSAVLQRIIKAGPRDASLRYGRELGRCGMCNRTLTDENSRAAGIGPVCAQAAGW
jgi:hypothetical protein